MRLATSLLLLPSLVLAQEQKPLVANLQSWFQKAKSYIPTPISSPLDSGAAEVASRSVVEITTNNWRSTLTPSASLSSSDGPENWMVFVTGGNKSCAGTCGEVEAAWNKSAAILAADPKGPKLGVIDCDKYGVLCTTWFTGPPVVWYFQLPIPAADQSKPATPAYIVRLNSTTTTTQDIVNIHTKRTYEENQPVEGAFHPFDGWLAQYQLNTALGYVLFVFSKVPSWSVMLVISFITRSMM